MLVAALDVWHAPKPGAGVSKPAIHRAPPTSNKQFDIYSHAQPPVRSWRALGGAEASNVPAQARVQ